MQFNAPFGNLPMINMGLGPLGPMHKPIEPPSHQLHFSRHLYAAGEMTFQRVPNGLPQIQGNAYTEKKCRKYFGKKLRSLATSSKGKIIPISTYRCKRLKTLTVLTDGAMKSPIISLKKLEIVSQPSSLTRIAGYKNLISLKIDRNKFALKPDLARQLRKLVHLRSLSLKVFDSTLAPVSKYILGLKSLKHLEIQIDISNLWAYTKHKAIVGDICIALMKSKTLSYLRLSQHITTDSNDLAPLLQALSQAVIPNFDIELMCEIDFNVAPEILEAALNNVDLLTIDRKQYSVSLSTNQENLHQTMAQARRELKILVSFKPFQKHYYIPRAQLFNPDTTKNEFDLTESLKLLFCDTLTPSFSLFNASNIQCVKAIRADFEPLQDDKTLEGLKNLQAIIQNSPSLERFEMSGANFGQHEAFFILDELAKLQQLETLEFGNAKFDCNSEKDVKKAPPSFSRLKKISLRSSYIKMDELPFEFTSSKNLTELGLMYSSLDINDKEKMLKTIKKLSNLEKIQIIDTPTAINDILFFSDETDVNRFIDTMSQLTKLKEIYYFANPERAFFVGNVGVKNLSKSLHEKAMELFKENKSIAKFIVFESSFDVKCIRY